MIHPYSNATQSRWETRASSGEPLADVFELIWPWATAMACPRMSPELKAIAQAENSAMAIEVKVLKTGREDGPCETPNWAEGQVGGGSLQIRAG